MISGKLVGGLGNQMFVIAAIYALALRNDDIAIFDFDGCYTPLQGHPSNKYKLNLFLNVPNGGFTPENILYPPEFPFHNLQYLKNSLYNGYFQSEKYFLDFSDEIRGLFSVKPKHLAIEYTTCHVRRGDYKNNPDIHPVLGADYYREAFTRIPKTNTIFVFSDDLQWCKDNFTKENSFPSNKIEFIDNNDEIESFEIMSGATHSVLANSSFSWWSSWFRKNQGITIAPKVWFGPQGPDYSDIIPARYIKI